MARLGTPVVAVVALLFMLHPAHAGDGAACRDQAARAEAANGIPTGLLLSIGKRESGRVDADAGGVLPWPWAVDRDGEGHLFDTRDEAIQYVAEALLQGSRSIDVGCFQINLQYHPTAFASLAEAFDPVANANYAARFLTELYARTGTWAAAVAAYHSAWPERGEPYRQAVFATWLGLRDPSPLTAMAAYPSFRMEKGIRIWSPGAAAGGSIVPMPRILPANAMALSPALVLTPKPIALVPTSIHLPVDGLALNARTVTLRGE